MAWLNGWSYRKTVTITGETGAGTNYQVNFSIGDAAGGDFHLESHCTSFPNDIQVTDNDQTTPLDYWVEDLTVDPISMWVEVADDLGSNVDICIYYGKSGEGSASDGNATFEFFDDFEGTSLDTDKWGEQNISYSISDSIITFTDIAASNWDAGIASNTSFGINTALVAYIRDAGTSDVFDVGYQTSLGDDTDRAAIEWYSDELHYMFTTKEGSTTSNANHPVFALDTWYRYEWIRESTTKVIWNRDGIEIANNIANIPTVDLPIVFETDDAYKPVDYRVDWILVRKYASPEPAFFSAGSEESAPTVAVPVFMHHYQNMRET